MKYPVALPVSISMGKKDAMILSPDELAKYDGSDPSLPLLICVKGIIFDVSPGRDFYGPGELSYEDIPCNMAFLPHVSPCTRVSHLQAVLHI